ncbi:MAG: SGNH/GDSL hydrolase family protein [Chthoniobacteraceae bacterium]
MIFPVRLRLKMLAALVLGCMIPLMHASASLEFSTFDQRATNGETLCVAFLGGSLTWGAQATDPLKTSYRALVSEKLRKTYPKAHFRFIDGAIGGTGSQLAAFRLQRDILAYKPDLVFLDFTINDNPYEVPSPIRLASYESLVHRMIEAGIPVVQVILPAKKDVLPNPPSRPLDPEHKKIGAAYGLPLADAVAVVKERVAAGKATPDQLWDLPEDGTHPGDAGYALYAETAWAAYEKAVNERAHCRLAQPMVAPDTYMTVNRCRLSSLGALPEGWKAGVPHRNAIAFDFVCSRWMDELSIATAGNATAPAPLVLNVRAAEILLFGEGTQKSGSYAVRIDGGEAKRFNAACKDGNMRLVQIVATGLDPAITHRVEIIPELKEGQELRLESVCLAGAPASIELAK